MPKSFHSVQRNSLQLCNLYERKVGKCLVVGMVFKLWPHLIGKYVTVVQKQVVFFSTEVALRQLLQVLVHFVESKICHSLKWKQFWTVIRRPKTRMKKTSKIAKLLYFISCPILLKSFNSPFSSFSSLTRVNTWRVNSNKSSNEISFSNLKMAW